MLTNNTEQPESDYKIESGEELEVMQEELSYTMESLSKVDNMFMVFNNSKNLNNGEVNIMLECLTAYQTNSIFDYTPLKNSLRNLLSVPSSERSVVLEFLGVDEIKDYWEKFLDLLKRIWDKFIDVVDDYWGLASYQLKVINKLHSDLSKAKIKDPNMTTSLQNKRLYAGLKSTHSKGFVKGEVIENASELRKFCDSFSTFVLSSKDKLLKELKLAIDKIQKNQNVSLDDLDTELSKIQNDGIKSMLKMGKPDGYEVEFGPFINRTSIVFDSQSMKWHTTTLNIDTEKDAEIETLTVDELEKTLIAIGGVLQSVMHFNKNYATELKQRMNKLTTDVRNEHTRAKWSGEVNFYDVDAQMKIATEKQQLKAIKKKITKVSFTLFDSTHSFYKLGLATVRLLTEWCDISLQTLTAQSNIEQ